MDRTGKALIAALSAAAALPAQYASSAACAVCHPRQHQQQSKTAHALALRRTAEHPLADRFFQAGEAVRLGFRFFFLPGPRVRISGGGLEAESPLEWAFGSGVQAVTFVSRVDRNYYVEHFHSYYTALNALGPTPGQDALKPANLGESAGLLYKTRDPATGIDGCFACHSTGVLAFDGENAVQPAEPGVRCEACHGAGAAHVRKPSRANVRNPARMPPSGQLALCGGCHRPPDSANSTIDWNYAWNVRHAPLYLAESACYQRSGKLACLTCHAPHSGLERSAATYNAICANCHAQRAAACATNCVDCHMPAVSPQPPLRFTNHWIGVYAAGAKLRPVGGIMKKGTSKRP